MKLEDVSLSDVYPIRVRGPDGAIIGTACDNSARFFAYHGKTYFENKPATWPPSSDSRGYHRVARLQNGKVVDVCNFKIETSVQVVRNSK
jgi:hypothetical protein